MIKHLTLAVAACTAVATQAAPMNFSAAPKHAIDRNLHGKTISNQYVQRRAALIQRQLASGNEQASSDASQPEQTWAAATGTEDHVLVLLIEFPDQLHTAITPADTANYYAEYSPEHYNKMLFAKQSYAGPSGQPLISVRNYLSQQSGGSYNFAGQVFGWYQASQPMAAYGGNDPDWGGDIDPRSLVIEALQQAIADPNFDMAYFDQKDVFDLDGDGILNEPDGIIDHISVFHSAIDEAAGGSEDAIWSHRWSVDDNGPLMLAPGVAAFNYTIQPIDAAAGVVAHEFGHDLGLPDEYDIDYSYDGQNGSPGSTVGNWSIMATGSYAGEIQGTEPVGYSPFAKEFLQRTQGGNWQQAIHLHADELTAAPQQITLEAAASKGELNDVVRIDLPRKVVETISPLGEQSFLATPRQSFNGFAMPLDLLGAQNAKLSFKVNTDTHVDASAFFADIYTSNGMISLPIQLNGELYGSLSGTTDGWQDASIDLSEFVNDFVFVELSYQVYGNETGLGVGLDNVEVVVDDNLIERFYADDDSGQMTWLFGFDISQGNLAFDHYYLLEWRAHVGVDEALTKTTAGTYAPGLVIWYVDTSFREGEGQGDNATGSHPGEGWLSVVDANREIINLDVDFYYAETGEYHSTWSGAAESMHQVKDAAFNNLPHTVDAVSREFVPFGELYYHITREDKFNNGNPTFADWDDYSNYARPATGTKLPHYGLVIQVLDQNETGDQATISVSKIW